MKTPLKILRFYNSSKWRRFQKYIRTKRYGICETCGNAGWEVHHIVPLTLNNVDDDEIAIGEDNVQLLCTSCHNAKREEESHVRQDVTFDANGNLVKKDTPRS
jgi:5-methylcytosine-specific restriction endonuclease McrA